MGKHTLSRSKQWTTLLFVAVLVSLFYTSEVSDKLTAYYASTLSQTLTPADGNGDRPPSYTDLREWEVRLPQHNLDLPFPEGRSGRFVLFSNSRAHPVGWNNKLNDMLMNTWLAYSSNRAYVFHDFVWTRSHYPWAASSYGQEWTPRTPLNALISGPSAGGPWEQGDNAPRSISEAWFDIVCPKSERRIIHTRDVKSGVYWADGKVIFEKWQRLLSEAPERCIEVVPGSPEDDPFPETFDIWFWSTERSISLWDEFKVSPVSRLLGTSGIVQSAIDDNRRLFHSNGQSTSKDPFDNVLSIHVRRGDFKEACLEHAAENSTFYNWNLLSFLPDKFYPPAATPGIIIPKGRNTPDNEAIFLARCLPSAASITHKVQMAREAYLQASPMPARGSLKPNRLLRSKRPLDVLYIMSNDRTVWLDNLKDALRKDGWDRIVTSGDLKLNSEQKDVSVAVDMDIGRRSAVFIGNGWSSFTSNVVHRRLVDGKEPISIRFW
ncbi:hypothetical protein GALMADRAFT_87810 [Galerina marginata CBS 339.88]|uniref:Uncharacterized protein n=1 Tax=Galerina marginata (strain CBS 339.88) TaxID=685588 RepID=A0A067TH08_GALM3|nr:hypothetical protein GALMADRAFT_87810 [Galerina marginata CBS 339.88]